MPTGLVVPDDIARTLLDGQRRVMDAKTFASEYYSYLWQSKNVNDPHVSFTTEAFGVKTGREHCVPKVPVRRRGPWHGDGTDWEDWHDGVYHKRNLRGHPYRVKNGVLEYLSWRNEWRKACVIDGLNGVELHAPKGYDGPVPEGCVWLDETLKPGDRVRLLGDPCIAKTFGEHCLRCVGKSGTVRVRADEDEDVGVEMDKDLCHTGLCWWSTRLCDRIVEEEPSCETCDHVSCSHGCCNGDGWQPGHEKPDAHAGLVPVRRGGPW